MKELNDYQKGYRDGFVWVLENYGIWKDGTRRIGCQELPIREVIAELDEQMREHPNRFRHIELE